MRVDEPISKQGLPQPLLVLVHEKRMAGLDKQIGQCENDRRHAAVEHPDLLCYEDNWKDRPQDENNHECPQNIGSLLVHRCADPEDPLWERVADLGNLFLIPRAQTIC